MGYADDCGGCKGIGKHKRWCPNAVGHAASMRGRWAEQAENLGDQVGANATGAANMLYAAGALLKADAEVLRREWEDRQHERPDE